jgi:hypothetical protein
MSVAAEKIIFRCGLLHLANSEGWRDTAPAAAVRLRDLLGESREVEVIAPNLDFAGLVELEHPGYRDISLLAVFHNNRVAALVGKTTLPSWAVFRILALKALASLHEAVRHHMKPCVISRMAVWPLAGVMGDIVPYGVLGEVTHDLVHIKRVQAAKGSLTTFSQLTAMMLSFGQLPRR